IPDTVRIIELESLPLGYMPGNTVRIRAKAAGTLSTCLSPAQESKVMTSAISEKAKNRVVSPYLDLPTKKRGYLDQSH
ncbi:hypothetical protein, partial [Candidatus Hamiltonella defensa]|uniref:hypothetical protein n=1 Tax=Candidatus Williamhamiltonella defendens TaxID=138072 RepID=UPI001C2E6788